MKTMALAIMMALALDAGRCSSQSGTTAATPPADSTAAKPKTKLEAFSAKTGAVVIVGFTTIGTLKGQFSEEIEVDAREMRDAATGRVVSGLSLHIKADRYNDRTCFVDEDEIESLVKGLDYISKATNSITKLTSFEARYRTLGDLELVVFSETGGGRGAAVTCGSIGKARSFLKFEDLAELRNHFSGVAALLARNRGK
jgi:hypothetical protein